MEIFSCNPNLNSILNEKCRLRFSDNSYLDHFSIRLPHKGNFISTLVGDPRSPGGECREDVNIIETLHEIMFILLFLTFFHLLLKKLSPLSYLALLVPMLLPKF